MKANLGKISDHLYVFYIIQDPARFFCLPFKQSFKLLEIPHV